MRAEICQLHEHGAAILDCLTHTDDTTAAHGNTGIAHVAQSLEPLLLSTRRDDRLVVTTGGVDIVIVGVETRVFERRCLVWLEHAKRAASFEAERLDPAN